MSRTVYFRGTSGSTYYVKPLPLATPWGDDDVAGTENGSTGSFSFASLDEGTEYEVFLQAGGSPADSDEAVAGIDASQVDLVDAPNSTAVGAIQSGLSTFDASTDEVTTDAASRTASQADVSGLATAAALAVVDSGVDSILVDTGTTIPAQISLLNDLSAAEIRSALGLSNANLDTQLGKITDYSAYGLTVLCGATSNPQNASALYTQTLDGTTYSVTYASLAETGFRATSVLAKI